MSMVFMAAGHTFMGMVRRDKDGNIVSKTDAHFEPDPDGGSIAVGKLDPDTREQIGAAEPFGDWDAAGYLSRALELLRPNRPVNIPDFKAILKRAVESGGEDYFCEHCQGVNCRDCVVGEWKDESQG